jgi:hypothetical protein
MWINITALIFAIAGCFWGLKKGVLSAWTLMFNIMISVYLGIMTVAIIGRYSPDTLSDQWVKAGVVFLTAVLLFVLLTLLSMHFFNNYPYPDLPRYFELIGSGLFGFIGGYLGLWFLVYVFCITPASKIESMAEMSGESRISSRSRVEFICNILESLSLQEDDGQSENLYLWIETAPEKEKIKRKISATSVREPDDSNDIKDPNAL